MSEPPDANPTDDCKHEKYKQAVFKRRSNESM
jgi:hypothetical protein